MNEHTILIYYSMYWCMLPSRPICVNHTTSGPCTNQTRHLFFLRLYQLTTTCPPLVHQHLYHHNVIVQQNKEQEIWCQHLANIALDHWVLVIPPGYYPCHWPALICDGLSFSQIVVHRLAIHPPGCQGGPHYGLLARLAELSSAACHDTPGWAGIVFDNVPYLTPRGIADPDRCHTTFDR